MLPRRIEEQGVLLAIERGDEHNLYPVLSLRGVPNPLHTILSKDSTGKKNNMRGWIGRLTIDAIQPKLIN